MADTTRQAGTKTIAAPGLGQKAEILIDRWGIAHIYAASQHDVFYAQGWNAARERLWQLDLWRKRGLGRLAENFGPSFAAQDVACRLFLYRGDMEAEWAAYGPNAKGWTEAFVEGLNAYVAQVRSAEAPLPVEFGLTGTTPDFWAASDVVRIRSHGISNNAESEALRARVAAAGGIAADCIRRKVEPAHEVKVPEGLDLADIPDDLLATYTLATKEVSFAALAGEGAPETAAAPARAADAADGSNNWAIAPARTATGRAILASDPHRSFVAPSIRYLAHLEAPGISVIGAGEPHLPGITIGHNDRIAFGITTFMADQADHYVYELNPENARQYRYGGGWQDLAVVRETLVVRGEESREIELLFTRHGPVTKIDGQRRRAYALRTVWTLPGTAAYFGAARYQTAGDWETFKTALAHWRAAPMNFVYADVAGNIGWIPAGLMPKRPNWDGLTPVPGDGRYEWAGFAAQDELPCLHNPERGWVASANELNTPAGHPAEGLGYEWADPGRVQRIAEVLSANSRATVADSLALQTDILCLAALRGVGLLRGLTSPDPTVAAALRLLMAWDGRETTDSAAAAIAEVWLNKHLAPATAARITTAAAAKIIGFGSPYATIAYLQAPDSLLGADPIAAREAVLLESLSSALAELTERLGTDMAVWTWGALHHAYFEPPAAALAEGPLRARMVHGPTPMPGSAFTVRAATYRMEDFAMTVGASFRMVVDVGDWDASLVINSPGQSGDPDSPHYADLFGIWAEGGAAPMLWSRPAVEAATREVIELLPT
jgi:penicillin amidase